MANVLAPRRDTHIDNRTERGHVLPWTSPSPAARTRTLIGLALVVGLGARFYLILHFVGNFDEQSYDLVAGIMLRGGNVYAETWRYNYSPVWAYCLLAFAHIARALHLYFHFVVRGFLSGVDVADATLIGYIASRVRPGKGAVAFAAYLLNPVTILLVGYHGQFENFAMLPLLGAVALLIRRSAHPTGGIIWILGTLAILIKQLTVFSVWMLFVYAFKGRRRILAMVASGGIFAASFIPFLPAGLDGIINHVLLYNSAVGFYGFGAPPAIALWLAAHLHLDQALTLETAVAPYRYAIIPFGLVLGGLPFVVKNRLRKSLPQAMEFCSVALLATLYGIAEQYFILPTLFGSVFLSLPYILYSAAVALELVNSGTNLGVLGGWNLRQFQVVINLVWLTTLFWLWWLWRVSSFDDSSGSKEPSVGHRQEKTWLMKWRGHGFRV